MFRSLKRGWKKSAAVQDVVFVIVAMLFVSLVLLLMNIPSNIFEEPIKGCKLEVEELKEQSLQGEHVDQLRFLPLSEGSELSSAANSSLPRNLTNLQKLPPKVRRIPQAIIIGARKSGTRALLKFLELNPSVRAAHNEVHFFDKDQNYKLGLDWYRSQMPLSSPGELTIEKSPAYFVTAGVPNRIKAMNSSIKLVLILRDPVTRLISDFSQLLANKIESPKLDAHNRDLEIVQTSGDEYVELIDYAIISNNSDILGYQVEGKSSDGGANQASHRRQVNESALSKASQEFESYVLRPDGGIDEQRRAIRIGMYSNYLERWKASFSDERQFHFVDGEALIEHPYGELHKLELFLGLKPTIRPEDFVFNSRKGFYCLANASSINSSKGERSSDWAAAGCLSKSKGRKHVSVREDLVNQLRTFYAPYNEYLYSLTGINFSWPIAAKLKP